MFAVVIVFVFEYVFYRSIDYIGNPERHFQRGRILISLDRVYGLTAYPDELRELLLRHLTAMESIPPNGVGKRHDSQSPAIMKELHCGLEDRCRNPTAEQLTAAILIRHDNNRQRAPYALFLKGQVH